MSETEVPKETEGPESTRTTEEDKQPKQEPKPSFKIESLDDMKRVLTIARGGDPDAIQAIAQFMDMKSNIERSYFPDKHISICVAQLTGYGKTYFPEDSWDPFSLVADCLSIGFMPYKGFKSNQFVDMTRQTPNLDALQTTSDEVKQGVLSRVFGRGKER